MALVKFGSIIVDSRGSIGGMTIKSTRGGLVMQTKPTPKKKITRLQSIARSRLGELSKDWFSNLSAGQRDDWRALAEENPVPNVWGDEYPLSGVAFFIRVNLTLYAIDETKIYDAPANQAVTAITSVTLSVTAPNTASLAWTATPTPANHILLIEATPKLSPGINNYESKFFFLDHGAAAQASPINIASVYNDAIGDFRADAQYAARAAFVNILTGARSAYIVSAVLAS